MTVEQYKELRARFKKHFPDALFFVNRPNDEDFAEMVADEKGNLIVNPLENEFVTSDILPICGCGYHNEVAALFYSTLSWCGYYDPANPTEYVEGKAWMPQWDVHTNDSARLLQCTLLYWLDELGYTEHGSSVFGSWLTEKGRCARDVLGVAIGDYKLKGTAI